MRKYRKPWTKSHLGAAVDPIIRRMQRLLTVLSLLSLAAGNAFAAEYSVPQHDEMFGAVQVISARYEDTFVEFAFYYNVRHPPRSPVFPCANLFRSGDGHIHALWFDFATGWHHEDRSTLVPGVPAAVDEKSG